MIHIPIIIIPNYYWLCSSSPASSRSITFKNEGDILLWTLAKLVVTFEEHRYLFAAQSFWWISALVQLDSALPYIIDTWKFRLGDIDISEIWESMRPRIETDISPTPSDIPWQSESQNYEIPVLDSLSSRSSRMNLEREGSTPHRTQRTSLTLIWRRLMFSAND